MTCVGFIFAVAVFHPADTTVEPRSATARGGSASTLWVLAVGVSSYSEANLDLRYADADARQIAAAFDTPAQDRVYRDVRTIVLTDAEVTRESVLGAMKNFLGRAERDDVVAIFIAGHGVRDRQSGSYYFLPSPAGGGNFETAGLHMSALADALQMLRHRARGVVMMLDTCHAGALDVADRRWERMDEPAGGLAPSEDLFILAATKPGEESHEDPTLGHGAFSYALLQGVAGAADADGDDLVSLGELFAYVAREVPRLTGDAQHPYYRIEGSDFSLVAVAPDGRAPGAPPIGFVPPPIVLPTRDRRDTVAVASFDDLRADPEHRWFGQALRLAFNTELSKIDALRVYAPEIIDRTAKEHDTDALRASQSLAVGRVIAGSYSVIDARIRIDARIVDAASGVQEGSESVEGELEEFFELQKQLVLRLLQRLKVRVSPVEGAAIGDAEHMDIDAYRLLLESEDAIEAPPSARKAPTTAPPEPYSSKHGNSWLGRLWPLAATSAYADEAVGIDIDGVRRVLAEYRGALEAKDVERLASLYVSFAASRREAQQRYFDNADDLKIEIADITVEPHATGLLVTYTRRDAFTDRTSKREVRLEVRLSRIFVRQGDTWKIGGKP